MKTKRTIGLSALVLGMSAIVLIGGCHKMSELEKDPSAGMNGGFETSRNGLPVNWLMYTPNTVPDADFSIVLDRVVRKQGKQSLRFDVKRCAERGGGWHSPGFTNEFSDHGTGRFGEGRYRLSFWVRNNGSTYCIAAGGVSAKSGAMNPLVESNETTTGWKQLEYEVNVPKDAWLRLELNILKPGTFWIDDVQIECIGGNAG